MENVTAITFDVGGTLIDPWPSVGHVYAAVAARHGVRAEPEELTHRFVDAWKRKENFNYTQDDWAGLVDATFAGLTTTLPSQSFFGELYLRFAEPDCWRVYEDVIPALNALRERNVRLAVISNWDIRLRPLLQALDIADWFEVIHVSSELGSTKPDRRIFQVAIDSFGLSAAQILHVGDSEIEDHRGAKAAGMQSRLLCRDCNEQLTNTINSLSSFV